MQHYWSLDDVYLDGCWQTIGSFDGVHLGHQTLLKKLIIGAHKNFLPAVVLTFHPHPAVVLRNRQNHTYLTSPEEKAELLGNLGVDIVITHPFTRELSNMSARDFLAKLQRHLRMTHLFVGYDFALGRGREGDISVLRLLGEEFDYRLDVINPVEMEGEKVSSSQIRNALFNGEVEKAHRLLGRPYKIGGMVIHGDGRGRLLEIPTANLQVWKERALPKSGVYICMAHLETKAYKAVTNVGYRPTFDNRTLTPVVETHILDFKQDLYGKTIELSFMARLRDEQKFPDIQSLIEQILYDIERARSFQIDTGVMERRTDEGETIS